MKAYSVQRNEAFQASATSGEAATHAGPATEPVTAVTRALALLESLAHSGSPLPLGRIARLLRLAPSTTHRLLRTLVSQGYVSQEASTGRYQATLKLHHLGHMVSGKFHYVETILPWMRRVAERLGESVTLVGLDGEEGILLERVESSEGIQVFAKYPRVPLYCTAVGKSILSTLPPNLLDTYLQRVRLEARTANTITDPEAFRREIAKVRQAGFALDREELFEGIRCVAVPLAWVEHCPTALGVSALSSRLSPTVTADVARLLASVNAQIRRALFGSGSSFPSRTESRERLGRRAVS